MKELYMAEGILNRGFVGQIAYTVCLEAPCSRMDIHFRFDPDKRTFRPEEIDGDLIEETRRACREEYGLTGSDEDMRRAILTEMKTEIHTLATLNGEFIGCVHKQLTDRHMLYDGGYASEGCIPRDRLDGVLRVTVLVFNVIKDRTRYTLRVSAE